MYKTLLTELQQLLDFELMNYQGDSTKPVLINGSHILSLSTFKMIPDLSYNSSIFFVFDSKQINAFFNHYNLTHRQEKPIIKQIIGAFDSLYSYETLQSYISLLHNNCGINITQIKCYGCNIKETPLYFTVVYKHVLFHCYFASMVIDTDETPIKEKCIYYPQIFHVRRDY
jgi:hypothetical protein